MAHETTTHKHFNTIEYARARKDKPIRPTSNPAAVAKEEEK